MFGRSLFFPCAGAVLGVGLLGQAADAMPVTSVPLADGNVLDVQSVVGSGPDTAYEVVDFSDGVGLAADPYGDSLNTGPIEAWQYNFTGSVDGFTMLTDIIAATDLRADDPYYAPLAEHEILYLSLADGGTTTAEYPALYFSPPDPADPVTDDGTGSQGITFEQAQVGIDDLTITNGEIIGWSESYDDVPVLPETAVPEPATVSALAVTGALALARRRRD